MVTVHCETTTGILNPIEDFGVLLKKYGIQYIVDSMNAFGAVPVDLTSCHIDFLISSSNKCLAFNKALTELKEEGGVEGRTIRYQANFSILKEGMSALGFTEYLKDEHQGYIINT